MENANVQHDLVTLSPEELVAVDGGQDLLPTGFFLVMRFADYMLSPGTMVEGGWSAWHA